MFLRSFNLRARAFRALSKMLGRYSSGLFPYWNALCSAILRPPRAGAKHLKFTMPDSYHVQSTSRSTAAVEDIWLNPPEDRESARTRRVLRAEIVDNVHSDEARIKACLVHQRRHTGKGLWQDVDAFKLAELKGGQEVRLQLGAAETFHLFKELERLHRLSEGGVPRGDRRFVLADESDTVVVKGPAKQVINRLLEDSDEEFWNVLGELQPDLFKAVALAKLHEVRETAVKTFAAQLDSGEWSEDDWQIFFENNSWIFGYGLSYRFLSTIQAQPNYGGTLVTGQGGQRGDFLAATEAERRFTVLVEIKKPESTLVGDKLYRNKVHLIGGELAGGVTQLQSNCRTWEIVGARDEENRELLERREQYTVQPKGILIVGHTRQLDSVNKRNTFELFRRNLFNPEVITFDELLERARHLLLNEERHLEQGTLR
jgi:hypothetical protein